jgi:anti-sigma factor RsiW
MLTCRELIGFLDDYRDQRLPAGDVERFEWHLARCPDCVAYLASYDRTLQLARLAEAPEASPGGDVPSDLVAAILASRAGSRVP